MRKIEKLHSSIAYTDCSLMTPPAWGQLLVSRTVGPYHDDHVLSLHRQLVPLQGLATKAGPLVPTVWFPKKLTREETSASVGESSD